MELFRLIHSALVRNHITRRHQRRFTRFIKRSFNCPDAYGDMLTIAKMAKPTAILDIGSFVGDTVVRFLDEFGLPVFGFEPTPSSFELLRQRFKNEARVKLFNCALANHEGEVSFYSNQNSQTNSLLENDEGNIQSFPVFTRHCNVLRINTKVLDKWADEHIPEGLLLIKADVQGAEERILDGGTQTFKNRVVALFTEVQLAPMYKEQATFASLHERLQDLGFCLYNLYPCFHDSIGKAVQTDGLWVKEMFLQQHSTLSPNSRDDVVLSTEDLDLAE